jgi:hypothetical protein
VTLALTFLVEAACVACFCCCLYRDKLKNSPRMAFRLPSLISEIDIIIIWLRGTSHHYIEACQKACRYNNDKRLWEIFLVKCQKQAFSFNKREAKVYCYAFLHVLKRDSLDRELNQFVFLFVYFKERYMHKTSKHYFFSFMQAAHAWRPDTLKYPG